MRGAQRRGKNLRTEIGGDLRIAGATQEITEDDPLIAAVERGERFAV